MRTLDAAGNPKQTGISAFAQVVGGLIGKATSEKDGLMPKNLAAISLTENEVWYEVTGDCMFFYRYAHPYNTMVAVCTMKGNWSQANGFIKEVLSGGSSDTLNDFIRTSSDSVKKIYVKCLYTSDGSTSTHIIPIYGNCTIKRTMDSIN